MPPRTADLGDDVIYGKHAAPAEDNLRLTCTIHLEVGDVACTHPIRRHLLDHSFLSAKAIAIALCVVRSLHDSLASISYILRVAVMVLNCGAPAFGLRV